MTAYAMKGDRERCLTAGMDAYLSKPINAAELRQLIDNLTDPTAASASGSSDHNDLDEVDFDALTARAGGDTGLAHELVEIFLDDCPKFLSEIREAVEREDSGSLERAAHTAKGALVYFSNGNAFKAVLRLQQMAVEGDLRGSRQTLVELEKSFEQIRSSLRDLGVYTQ